MSILSRGIAIITAAIVLSAVGIYLTIAYDFASEFQRMNNHEQALWVTFGFVGIWVAAILGIVWMCKGKE